MDIKAGKMTETIMQEKWWSSLVKGLLLVAFGILTISWPGLTLQVLVYIIGAIAFGLSAYKFFQILRYNKNKEEKKESLSVLFAEAVIAAMIGILAFALPGSIEVLILVLFGLGMIFYGAIDFWLGFSLNRKMVSVYYKWIMVLGGVFSVIIGMIVLLNPVAGLLSILWLISTYAIVYGVIYVALAFTHPNR